MAVSDASVVTELNETCPHYLNSKGEHLLNTKWVLWHHSFDSGNWELNGYNKYATISTVEEFWLIYNDLPSINNKDMWFLMRDGIPPRWEDPKNKEGGSFKFRVRGEHAENTWLALSSYLVTENICINPVDSELISGLGVSPKNNGYVTISVWNLDQTRTKYAVFPSDIPGIDFKFSLYQAHCQRKCG